MDGEALVALALGSAALKETIGNLANPAAKRAGDTLGDLWDLAFGGFSTYVEKKRAEREKDLEDFRKSLAEKVCAIPEDQIQEPPLSVVGPAMEAAKYYFEEETIREMFANLIAAAMDKGRSDAVHPAFTEIIKQMSPLDAQNLRYFERHGADSRLPLVEYRLVDEKHSYRLFTTNVFLSNPEERDLKKQARSINALSRLGLVTVTYDTHLTDLKVYQGFEETLEYKALAAECPPEGPQQWRANIAQGEAILTPMGELLREICLPGG